MTGGRSRHRPLLCSVLRALKQNEDVRRVTVSSGTKRGAAIHNCRYSVTLSHRSEVFLRAPNLLTLLSISTKMPSVVEQRRLLVRAEEFPRFPPCPCLALLLALALALIIAL